MDPTTAALLRAMLTDEQADADNFDAPPRALLFVAAGAGGDLTTEAWPIPPWWWITMREPARALAAIAGALEVAATPDNIDVDWAAPLRQLIRPDYAGIAVLTTGTAAVGSPDTVAAIITPSDLTVAGGRPARHVYGVTRAGAEVFVIRTAGEVFTDSAEPGEVPGGWLLDGDLCRAVRRINAAIVAGLAVSA